MQQALELARQGIAQASPNPCVGAVLVAANGEIVGRGSHTYAGKKHAEVLAIEEAGERARGATLYLNLEPCSHVGRTGPCADAVIAAGIQARLRRHARSESCWSAAAVSPGCAKLRESRCTKVSAKRRRRS